MSQPRATSEIREAILRAAVDLRPNDGTDAPLQTGPLFDKVTESLGGRQSTEVQQEILTQWHDLLRTGYFAWGLNLANPNPPFFHFTKRGVRATERLERDPGNPSGYLRHVGAVATMNPVADSYLRESLACFEAGQFKAAAVMVGAASESMVIELRDQLVASLGALSIALPSGLNDWRIKTALDAMHKFIDGRKTQLPRPLREEFESYFLAFAQQIRASRNDAGHPTSVDPVTEDSVHASFLIFPELARLSNALTAWIAQDLR